MKPGGKNLTLREYLARPEEAGVQLVAGGLVMEPPPSTFHQEIVANLAFLLIGFVRAKALGKVLFAPVGVYLSDRDALQPDIMFVANRNLGILRRDGAHGAPDLVVEVLSPSTAVIDAQAKREIYCRHGVKEMWLVDPKRRCVLRFEFQRDPVKPVQIVDESGTFSSALLPGLEVSAAEIFRT